MKMRSVTQLAPSDSDMKEIPEEALKDPCLNAVFTRPGATGTSVYEGLEGMAVVGAAGETPASSLNLVSFLLLVPRVLPQS